MLPFVLLFSILSIVQQATCWGSLGHRTVAYFAQKQLTAEAKVLVNNLLDGEDISDAAIWPDTMAEEVRMMKDTDANDDPPASCGVKYDRDCLPAHGCVVSAITNMTSRIRNVTLPRHQHHEALKFLLHFIGDIHQPLHTEAGERGGNRIPVLFNKAHTNLHSIWDTEMPEKHARGPNADEKEDAMKWAEQLSAAAIKAGNSIADECTDITEAEGCALEWATEANTYICSYVLKDDVGGVEGKNLAGEYYDGAVPIIEHLLGKAGVRLAGWLNALAAVGPLAEDDSVTAPLLMQGGNGEFDGAEL